MTDENQVHKQAEKVYREYKGPDGERMKVRVLPPGATVEEIEKAVIEDGAVAMTDEQAAKVNLWPNEGVRDGRAVQERG